MSTPPPGVSSYSRNFPLERPDNAADVDLHSPPSGQSAAGIGQDTTYNLIAASSPIVFALLVTPFYLKTIGPDRYGILAICWTVLAALRFTSLGMGPALTYRLSLMEDAEPAERARMTWTGIYLGLGASLAGALLVLAAGRLYFGYLFPPTSVGGSEISDAIPLLAAMFPLGVLSGVLSGALQGRRRFRALSAIAVLSAGLMSIAPLVTAYFVGNHLKYLFLASIVASITVLITQALVCLRAIPLNEPRLPRRDDTKALLGFGSWMSVTALIAPLVMVFDRFVIGALRGPVAVAVYVLPYNVVQGLVYVPASLSDAILPRLAPIREESDVRSFQSQALTWLNGAITPLCIASIALAAPFFRFWIGPELGSAASPIAVILLVGAWVHGIGHIPSAVVIGRRRPDLLAKLLLAYLVPYMLLLYFGTLWFGIIGAAAAWTIRAAFDPILFAYTRPYASDIRSILVSALFVLAAMTACLALQWHSPLYWALTTAIFAAACYQHRGTLMNFAGNLRRLIPALAPWGGASNA
jgi:O-antigen/teichoic acid export membrane protein